MSAKRKKRKEKRLKRMANDHSGYIDRNKCLNELGYRSYTEYLASPLWASIWARMIGEKGASCSVCGKVATQVHHMSYHMDVLKGVNTKPLKPVCRVCHWVIEFKPDGTKRTFVESQARAQQLLRKYQGKKLPPWKGK